MCHMTVGYVGQLEGDLSSPGVLRQAEVTQRPGRMLRQEEILNALLLRFRRPALFPSAMYLLE